jgi:hypothetical protein
MFSRESVSLSTLLFPWEALCFEDAFMGELGSPAIWISYYSF